MNSPDVRAALRAAFAPILDAANIGRDAQLHALVGIAVEKLAPNGEAPAVNGVAPADDVVDEKWIASQLHVTRARVAQMRRAGLVEGFTLIGRRVVYSRRRFSAWLAAGGRADAEAKPAQRRRGSKR